MSNIKERLENIRIRIENKVLQKAFGLRVIQYEHPREERVDLEGEQKRPVGGKLLSK